MTFSAYLPATSALCGLPNMEIRPAIAAEIHDMESARLWIAGMRDAQLFFHLEDDPSEIVSVIGGDPVFSADEVPVLNDRVSALYGFDWVSFECPIGYFLHIDADAL